MTEGKVKFFNNMKNFGFIAGDDGKDYFCHGSSVEGGVSLAEGDRVSFTPTTGDRGLKAEHVKKAGAAEKKPAKHAETEETEDAEDADADSDESEDE